MISAKLAKHYANEYNGRTIKTLKELENHIKQMAVLGFRNTSVDLPEEKVDKMTHKLMGAGFTLFIYKEGSPFTSPQKGYRTVEIEWYK